MHEASLHVQNCLVTLTYSDEFLPPAGGLRYADCQKFLKRLRKVVGRFRYLLCGEYGENLRGHYHIILFGLDFPDKYHYKTSEAGSELYRSPTLEKVWKFGHCDIGEVNYRSAGYVAGYSVDKVYGDAASAHYRRVDKRTGEVVDVVPEFIQCSRRPGVAFEWFRRFALSDCYVRDSVVVDGRECGVPSYYDRQLKRFHPAFHAELKLARTSDMRADRRFALEQGSKRRLARETVAKARLSFSKRSLK